MVSHFFFSQLMLIALVWLFGMLHAALAPRSPPALVSTSPSAVAASRQRRAPDNATRDKEYDKPVPLYEAHRVLLSAQRWQAGVCGCLVRGQQVAPAGVM